MHVDLIGPYRMPIRQHQLGGAINKNNVNLTQMTMVKSAMVCFEIEKVPTFDFNEVTFDNDEYVDNSSARVSLSFSNTWLFRYQCLRKVLFDNVYEFKR